MTKKVALFVLINKNIKSVIVGDPTNCERKSKLEKITMENCIRRFPVVGSMILRRLDDQTLVKNREISRKISEFIKNERFYWIRIIQKHNVNKREIIKKASIKDLKDLAIESEQSH